MTSCAIFTSSSALGSAATEDGLLRDITADLLPPPPRVRFFAGRCWEKRHGYMLAVYWGLRPNPPLGERRYLHAIEITFCRPIWLTRY